MGNDHDCGAVLPVHLIHKLQDIFRGTGIQGTGQLITEQQSWIFNHGSCNGRPLLLAAGKLPWETSAVLLQFKCSQHLVQIKRIF